MATEIRIDKTDEGTWWLYGKYEEWKNYVCADFDEKIVVYGNRDYNEIAETDWWKKAREIIDYLDCEGTMFIMDMLRHFSYNMETIAKVIKAYDNCIYSDDIGFVVEVAKMLTGRKLVTKQICGYAQREWQYIAYDKDEFDNDPTDSVEAFYFGKIADVTVIPDGNDDESYGDILTDDELWEMERDGLKEELRKRYDIPEDEELIVMQCDGYKRVADWKEVV